ncbi:hypothetical protein BVRB_3g060820 [Beta vulgaris subsp. vulgaris]|nr:hypothetical protein BVRB_3g060820 [Beta vulgaris subsp. vulgaris]
MENPINPGYYFLLFFIWFISIVFIFLKSQTNNNVNMPQLLQHGHTTTRTTFSSFAVHSIMPSLDICCDIQARMRSTNLVS